MNVRGITLFSCPQLYNFTRKKHRCLSYYIKINLKSGSENYLSYSSRKLVLSIYSTSLLETFSCVAVMILSVDMCLHFNIIPLLFLLICWLVGKNVE